MGESRRRVAGGGLVEDDRELGEGGGWEGERDVLGELER